MLNCLIFSGPINQYLSPWNHLRRFLKPTRYMRISPMRAWSSSSRKTSIRPWLDLLHLTFVDTMMNQKSLHFLLKFQAYLNNKSETVGPQRKKLFDYWFESVHKQSLDSAAIPLLVLRFLQSVTLKLTYLPFPCVCVETLFPAIFAFFRFFSWIKKL